MSELKMKMSKLDDFIQIKISRCYLSLTVMVGTRVREDSSFSSEYS